MFHPSVIAAKQAKWLQGAPDDAPYFEPYSTSDARALAQQISFATDDSGEMTRAYTPEEHHFIQSMQRQCYINARFFLETFVWIDDGGQGIRPLYPLWESQKFVLDRLAALELQRWQSNSHDGLLLNVLKVRQVGVSTLGVACVAHRTIAANHIRALVGSDVEGQASYLFRMATRVFHHLPHFMQPALVSSVKDREIQFENGSSLRTAWGKTTRGALQEVGGAKGNIERGRTHSVVHISELATWENPEQLDVSLIPGIPANRSTFVLFESTAELADDWWNRHWLASKKGLSRFANVFIPNYAVPAKYSLPAPEGFEPKAITKAWMEKAERESPQWFSGHTIRPTLDQAYWYETTRAYYETKGNLHGFFKEYPSDDEECFQYSGSPIFTLEQLERLQRQAKPVIDVWAVEPSREIAELRRLPPSDVVKAELDRRPPAPISAKLLHLPTASVSARYPVPPGYGFRRLEKAELSRLLQEGTGLRSSVMTIWEYPRTRGPRQYVLSADVADGIGQDYSVATVTRLPTIEEPAEEVAQYVSNQLAPKAFAFVLDAIGRLYHDADGMEALAAIECNNHGLSTQDTLQLHLGYTHFYVWEYFNAKDPEGRFSNRLGWFTTRATRPILLSTFYEAVTALDPVSESTDLILNSSITRGELRHLVIPPGGAIGDMEHAPAHHDDAVMASAIGYYVAYRLAGGEVEPIADRRRRRQALRHYEAQLSTGTTSRRDFRNTDVSSDQMETSSDGRDEDTSLDGDAVPLCFNDRATADWDS